MSEIAIYVRNIIKNKWVIKRIEPFLRNNMKRRCFKRFVKDFLVYVFRLIGSLIKYILLASKLFGLEIEGPIQKCRSYNFSQKRAANPTFFVTLTFQLLTKECCGKLIKKNILRIYHYIPVRNTRYYDVKCYEKG